jgi:cytoskeleton protein RodZ
VRQSRNISLDEVSEATGISTTVLKALEDEDKERLPAEVYIRAFYKKYADFLGIDTEETEAKYQEKAKSLRTPGSRFSFSTVITIKGQDEYLLSDTLRRMILPIAIVVLGLVLYWVYKNYLAPYYQFGMYREYFPSVISNFSPILQNYFPLC